MNRKDGHPDFEYSQRKFRQLDVEEKKLSEAIHRAFNGENFDVCPKCGASYNLYEEITYCWKCGYQLKKPNKDIISELKPANVEAERKKRVEMLQQEETEIDKPQTTKSPFGDGATAITRENRYHHHFTVPAEIYAHEEYHERLNNAKTLDEVEHIIDDYKHHRKEHEDKPQGVVRERSPKEKVPKKDYLPEERDLPTYDRPKTKPRRSIPIKKIVGASMVLVILGVFLWYSPTIISMLQNLSSQNTSSQNPSNQDSSYTKLTLIKNSSPNPNFTTLTFGDIDYSFSYAWQNNQYFLLVCNSILEAKSYLQPTNGSVYRDIGIEIKVSGAYSNQIVLLVKPTVQDYLASLSFKKLTIAQGQYQTVNFSGNEYTIGYLQNLPYYANKLIVMTPLLQSREYYIISSQIVSCDLGLEIRVYKATTEYAMIFVKPSY